MLSLLITAVRHSRLVTCCPGQAVKAHHRQSREEDKNIEEIEGLGTKTRRSKITNVKFSKSSKSKNTIHHFSILNSHVRCLHTTFIQVLPELFLWFLLCQKEWVLSQRMYISHVIIHFSSSSTSFRSWIGYVAYSQMTVNEYK